MYPSCSPACRAALHDMSEAGIDTTYLWNEDLVLLYAGVTKKPQYHWLKGQHQGKAFERAYKNINTQQP